MWHIACACFRTFYSISPMQHFERNMYHMSDTIQNYIHFKILLKPWN